MEACESQAALQEDLCASLRLRLTGSTKSTICFYLGVSINGGTQNGWFVMEHAIKMDDLEVPPCMEIPVFLPC